MRKVWFACIAALAVSACQSVQVEALTTHMQKRECATKGRVDVHPIALPGGKVTGFAEWDCGPVKSGGQ